MFIPENNVQNNKEKIIKNIKQYRECILSARIKK
jgi:hypothetical protein